MNCKSYSEFKDRIDCVKDKKYIGMVLTKNNIWTFGAYLLYTIGYLAYFFIVEKNLNSTEWIFLTIILFVFHLSVLSEPQKIFRNILLYLYIIFLVFFFREDFFINHSKYWLKLKGLIDYKFVFFLILFSLNLFSKICFIKKKNKEKIEEIYPERKEDLRYIYNFINDNNSKINVLGVNGHFGSGKSFLVEQLINEIKKEDFEIVKIRCLLLEKEEVYTYIAKQIDRVLIKNLIFAGHFEKLKNSLITGIDNKFWGGIGKFFIRETNIDDIENFKKAILKLNKKIILVFDDIDRVNEVEKTDRILSFISDFSSSNVKIIVLYHQENLGEINTKYSRGYLEKFIPITRDLSELSFSKLLKKEISKLDMDEKNFEFLLSFELPHWNMYQSKNREFRIELYDLIFNELECKFNFTPRNIVNFLEESKIYITDENLKIENRLIIAYCFLKHLFYEDFYQKIDSNENFEEMFPIKLKMVAIDSILTLEELDLLKNLVEKQKELKIDEDYFDINGKRIFLDGNHQETHINTYLRKMKIPPLCNKKDVLEKINEIKKLIDGSTIEIEGEESKKNAFIYSLMNYCLYFKNTEEKSFERKETIEEAIRKLKFIGREDYLSSYRRFYGKFIEIFDKDKFEEHEKEYQELLTSYYHNTGDFKGVFYFGDIHEYKIMKILNTFDDNENKIKFLEFIFLRDGGIITDDYIGLFYEGKIKDVKLGDFIVGKILEGKYEVIRYETIKKIRNNLKLILKRHDFYNTFESSENALYFQYSAENLTKIIEKNGDHYKNIVKIPAIKEIIERDIIFLETMKEISEKIVSNKFEKKETGLDIKVSSQPDENIKKIKNMESLNKKQNALVELLHKGYSFTKLEELHKQVIKND